MKLFALIALVATACVHGVAFESQCRSIKVGMARADAEHAMMTERLVCARWGDTEQLTVKWEPCNGEAGARAERMRWAYRVPTSTKEDYCYVELDAEKRVVASPKRGWGLLRRLFEAAADEDAGQVAAELLARVDVGRRRRVLVGHLGSVPGNGPRLRRGQDEWEGTPHLW